MKSLVVTIGKPQGRPWWWEKIDIDGNLCSVSYERIVFNNKLSQEITTLEIVPLMLKFLPLVLRMRKQFDYVFTFECDLTSFIIAFWQTVLFIKKPKHVILQFIMREKKKKIISFCKYSVMKFVFSSVHRIICSASKECDYYDKAFGWKRKKSIFVPMHTDSKFLNIAPTDSGGYIFATGRTFRDFDTFEKAVSQTEYDAIVISGKNGFNFERSDYKIKHMFDVPRQYFDEVLANSMIVVIPLVPLSISTGQMVLLQAMAMGKAVIATRTVGMEDYIDDGKTGLLVAPYNCNALRDAICLLMENSMLRDQIGDAAKKAVRDRYLPNHYARNVCDALLKQNPHPARLSGPRQRRPC